MAFIGPSGLLQVWGPPPTLTPDVLTVPADGVVHVTVTNAPDNDTKTWVAFDWQYLSGTQVEPAIPIEDVVLTFSAPQFPGDYIFRLIDGRGRILAVSVAVTVTPGAGGGGGEPGVVDAIDDNFPRIEPDSGNHDFNVVANDIYPPGSTPSVSIVSQSDDVFTATVVIIGGIPHIRVSTNSTGAPGASLTPVPTSVSAGGSVVVTVVGGARTARDWVGLYTLAETDFNNAASFQYLNGQISPPTTPIIIDVALTFVMPTTTGDYVFRFFANDSVQLADQLAISATVAVGASAALPADSFTADADQNLEDHTPDGGTSWSITQTFGPAFSLQVVAASDTLRSPITSGNTRGIIYVINPAMPSANYTVTVALATSAVMANIIDEASFTLFARYIDVNNYYQLVVNPTYSTGGYVELTKRVAGVRTVLAWTDVGVLGTPGAAYSLEVTATAIRALKDGVAIPTLTATPDAALAAAGQVGIGLGTADGYAPSDLDINLLLDNFATVLLAGGAPGGVAPVAADDTRNIAANETTALVDVLDNDTNVLGATITIPPAIPGSVVGATAAVETGQIRITRIGTAAGSYTLPYRATTPDGADDGVLSGTVAAFSSVAGALEAVNGAAAQVAVSVASTPRQAWYGFGFGLADPNGSTVMHPYMVTYADRLYTELNTKVLRLNTADLLYKPSVVFGLTRGVDMVIATGYIQRHGITPSTWADQIKAAIDGGMTITHTCLQNEPDGHQDNNFPSSLIVPWNTELRSRLNAIGLSAIKIFGIEWAHFGSRGEQEYDLLNAAGLIPGTVMAGGGHCYHDCPGPGVWDDRWLSKMGATFQGLFSPETGNASNPNRGARFITGLNHGVSVECQHYHVTVGAGSEPFAQALIGSDGVRRPWHGQCRVISNALTRGSRFRLATCDDRPAGLSVAFADRMIRDGGNFNPRINATAAKRPDNRWVILAVNATNGTGEVSSFVSACYPAALIQVTVTVTELSGTSMTFTGQRCSVTGALTTQTPVNMVSGVIRFTLAAGDTIALLSDS